MSQRHPENQRSDIPPGSKSYPYELPQSFCQTFGGVKLASDTLADTSEVIHAEAVGIDEASGCGVIAGSGLHLVIYRREPVCPEL